MVRVGCLNDAGVLCISNVVVKCFPSRRHAGQGSESKRIVVVWRRVKRLRVSLPEKLYIPQEMYPRTLPR